MADPIEEARRQTAVEAYETHMRIVHMKDMANYKPRPEDFTGNHCMVWFVDEATNVPSRLHDFDINVRMGGLTSDQAGEIEKLKPPPAPATKPPNEGLARAIGARKP